MSKTGDCVVKHGTNFTTGFGMVVSGSCTLFTFLTLSKQLEIEECQSSVEKLKVISASYKIQWINQKPNQIHLAGTQKVLSELWLVLVSLLIGSKRGVQ